MGKSLPYIRVKVKIDISRTAREKEEIRELFLKLNKNRTENIIFQLLEFFNDFF